MKVRKQHSKNVDHFYKDPDRYYEVDKCNAATATENCGGESCTPTEKEDRWAEKDTEDEE